MQQPLIGTINVTLALPASGASIAASAVLAPMNGKSAPAQAETPKLTPPAIGEYWPGQGGIYAGRREYPEGLCYVIFAASDVGACAFGEYGIETEATCHIDGRANTAILVNRGGSHPAADAAYAFTCDGHDDFYLPAIGELNHGWQFTPELFEKEWYWSSSQRSANSAFLMHFDGGIQSVSVKNYELRVRPVRRLPIQ